MREAALDAAARGDVEHAIALFDQAVDQRPADAALWNSYGNMLAKLGWSADAIARFDLAIAIEPEHVDATINRAVVIGRMDRPREAVATLRAAETLLGKLPRYWSARGGLEAMAGLPHDAAASYDACLAIDARHGRAAHGRARMALERSEADVVARYDAALTLAPSDPELWLGKALALEATGSLDEAAILLETLVAQQPRWIGAQEGLARLRWRRGERHRFCAGYASAESAGDADPELYRSWADMLAGVARHEEAADVARAGRLHFPEVAALAIAEAARAGAIGDEERADRILRSVEDDAALPHRARQAIRRGDLAHAEALLSTFLRAAPEDVGAWSLIDLCWRGLGDDRHAWLHGRQGQMEHWSLGLSDGELGELVDVLRQAHRTAAAPIGQSVRRGTQTMGALLARTEPIVRRFGRAIEDLIGRYRRALPPTDPAHPLLRHRDEPWSVVGSWSVRFEAEGHHVAHVHTRGVLSSALHLVVPPSTEDGAGWLDLGRPPADLRIDLPPLKSVRPAPGYCALFPSTVFHGTRPLSSGERLTAAFDAAPVS